MWAFQGNSSLGMGVTWARSSQAALMFKERFWKRTGCLLKSWESPSDFQISLQKRFESKDAGERFFRYGSPKGSDPGCSGGPASEESKARFMNVAKYLTQDVSLTWGFLSLKVVQTVDEGTT